MRALLVEDDAVLGGAVAKALTAHGFRVQHVTSGSAALEAVAQGAPDVVLLDMGLPDRDGIGVCRGIRAVSRVPILAVTGRGAVEARVAGLRNGADDYIVKPFLIEELLARIDAVLRRTRGLGVAPAVVAGDVEIDLARRSVSVDGAEVALARKEFDLLAALARREGAVVARDELLDEVWGSTDSSARRTLEAHVGLVRSKLGRPEVIVTARGVGYRLGK
ncbi:MULTISPECIES: response regulator transcription factor [Pseudonocardia]|uniref:Sensory transduction protein RegX3 n=1 Tax=Pseudonocardia oroxyli TaxID=366584 RepID=A0A1G7K5S9_PSEOR|nr:MULTISPECIES: response regulator transcription factor [Pseudonocardia]MCF7550077.1 response regulator transcription factor [Pseudonocardia sp. WMMC193]SDF32698.1 two component transcriptional regulator, winged helix family [Pseudonocardia oroxyli]